MKRLRSIFETVSEKEIKAMMNHRVEPGFVVAFGI